MKFYSVHNLINQGMNSAHLSTDSRNTKTKEFHKTEHRGMQSNLHKRRQSCLSPSVIVAVVMDPQHLQQKSACKKKMSKYRSEWQPEATFPSVWNRDFYLFIF